MPRLIMLGGPSSGEVVYLYNESFLGFRGGALTISAQADLDQAWAFIRLAGAQAELHNLAGPGAPLLLNGAPFQTAFIRHGDLLRIHDASLIFDSNESEHSSGRLPLAGGFSLSEPPRRKTRYEVSQMVDAGQEDELLGGLTSSISQEQITTRVRFRNHEEMVGALRDAKRMRILLRVAAKLKATDLPTLFRELLGIIFEVLPADRGTILLYDPERRHFQSMASQTRWGGEAKVRISRSIAKEVLRSKASMISADAQADARFDMGMSIVDEDIRSAICVPILLGEEIAGLIHVDSQDEANQFEKADCELLTAIAMQAALAIENARLIREAAEQERVRAELDLAATIQQQLLPRKLPMSSQIDVYGKMIPAKELGGDYFDFIDQGNGEFHICIGDVAGKGLPAGLVMIMARSYLRPLTRAMRSPLSIISETNRLLYQDTRRETFMSALLLYWSDRAGRFLWTGAGHEHLLVYRARTRRTEAIQAGGMVLAMLSEAGGRFVENELYLESGDAVVLYTDGITEAQNERGEFFAESSLEPLLAVVSRYGHLSAKDLLEAILWELQSFMGSAPQHDDITLVTIKRR